MDQNPLIFQFYVSNPSFIFVNPSFKIIPNSDGTYFMLQRPNGDLVPSTVDTTANTLVSDEEVQGWVQVAWWVV